MSEDLRDQLKRNKNLGNNQNTDNSSYQQKPSYDHFSPENCGSKSPQDYSYSTFSKYENPGDKNCEKMELDMDPVIPYTSTQSPKEISLKFDLRESALPLSSLSSSSSTSPSVELTTISKSVLSPLSLLSSPPSTTTTTLPISIDNNLNAMFDRSNVITDDDISFISEILPNSTVKKMHEGKAVLISLDSTNNTSISIDDISSLTSLLPKSIFGYYLTHNNTRLIIRQEKLSNSSSSQPTINSPKQEEPTSTPILTNNNNNNLQQPSCEEIDLEIAYEKPLTKQVGTKSKLKTKKSLMPLKKRHKTSKILKESKLQKEEEEKEVNDTTSNNISLNPVTQTKKKIQYTPYSGLFSKYSDKSQVDIKNLPTIRKQPIQQTTSFKPKALFSRKVHL